MCLSYAWQYKCGCIAPKPSNDPIQRCALWESRRSCQPKQLFSYLDVDCSVACRWDVGNESRRQQEDWYLRDVPYQGEPSEEDYYFYRVPTHLLETIKQRRRKTNAIRKEPLDNPDDREVVKFEVGKDTEMNDGEEVDSDIVVDESKPEEHISGANVGGRFTRRRK